MSRAAGVAARHNVTLYAVDPRGLPTGRRSSIQTRFLPGEGLGSAWSAKEGLRFWAEETGGFALVNSNQFRQGLERIVREQSTYYLLGYRAPREDPDGRLHQIRVRVDRPDVTVSARRSYVHTRLPDEPDDVSAQVSALLNRPLPQSDLRLELTGVPLRGEDAKARPVAVAVRLEPPRHAEGPLAVDLTLTLIAADEDGKVLARREAEVSLPAELRGAVHEHGLRVLTRLDLPKPERVHLRAAVVDRLTGARGTVYHEMDVPDFRSPSIAVSGLVVSSDPPVPTVTVGPDLPVGVPFAPAARRVFDAHETLAVFAEIHVNAPAAKRRLRAGGRRRASWWQEDADASRPERQLRVVSTISNDAGEIVFRGREQGLTVETAASYRVSLPLEGLGPGAYVLSVAASEEESGTRAGREVPFRVR